MLDLPSTRYSQFDPQHHEREEESKSLNDGKTLFLAFLTECCGSIGSQLKQDLSHGVNAESAAQNDVGIGI